MEKKNYIVVNGVKYYPVYAKNVPTCFYCVFHDNFTSKCYLSNTGINCETDYFFTTTKSRKIQHL